MRVVAETHELEIFTNYVKCRDEVRNKATLMYTPDHFFFDALASLEDFCQKHEIKETDLDNIALTPFNLRLSGVVYILVLCEGDHSGYKFSRHSTKINIDNNLSKSFKFEPAIKIGYMASPYRDPRFNMNEE